MWNDSRQGKKDISGKQNTLMKEEIERKTPVAFFKTIRY
jgi:uncharacterized protein YvpB